VSKQNLILFLLFSPLLFANESTSIINNYYIGGALDYQRIYNHSPKLVDTSSTQDNLGGLTLILGYKNLFDNYFKSQNFSLDIEGRITKSFWEESFAESTGYSIFAKPQYNVYKNKNINIYGLLGLGQLTIEGHNGDVPAHKNMIGKNIYDDISFQWGLGINADISKNLSLFIDYTSLIKDGDIDSTLYGYDSKVYQELSADAINIGMTYKFNLENLYNR